MAITQALDDDFGTPQYGTLSGTLNTATRIPQTLLNRKNASGRSGTYNTNMVSPGVNVVPMQGSGRSLSTFTPPQGSGYVPNSTWSGKNPKEMTYNDWAGYFASKGPSQNWDENTWQLFALLTNENQEDQYVMAAAKSPGNIPFNGNSKYFEFGNNTTAPGAGYALGQFQQSLAPWYVNQKSAWEAENGKWDGNSFYAGNTAGPYRYGVPSPTLKDYGLGGNPYTANELNAMQSRRIAVPERKDAWKMVDDRAYTPRGPIYRSPTEQESTAANEDIARLNSNDVYGIVVNGAKDEWGSKIPWISSYMPTTQPTDKRSGNTASHDMEAIKIGLQRKLLGGRR